MSGRGEAMDILRRSIADTLARREFLDRELIDPATEAIIDAVRRDLGGGMVWIPKPSADVADRVRADYNGRNRFEICRKYGISRSSFYRIIARHDDKPATEEHIDKAGQ